MTWKSTRRGQDRLFDLYYYRKVQKWVTARFANLRPSDATFHQPMEDPFSDYVLQQQMRVYCDRKPLKYSMRVRGRMRGGKKLWHGLMIKNRGLFDGDMVMS